MDKKQFPPTFRLPVVGAFLIAGAVAVAPVSAAELLNISHDGTSGDEASPFDTRILDGPVDWTYTTDGARDVMTAVDSATSGANRLILVQTDEVSEFTDNGTAAGKGWVFEIEVKFLAGVSAGSANFAFASFGVRSENDAGKAVWIGLNEIDGKIGFVTDLFSVGDGALYNTADLDVAGLIADGNYHNFKIHKYNASGTTTVDVFMDGRLVLSRAYSVLQDDTAGRADIQGFASGTPVPSSAVNIDFVNFTLYDNLIESTPAVAYWDFDNGNLNSVVNGSTYNLTQSGTGYTGSTTNLVNPVPNPDPVAGSANGGSIGSAGTGSSYLKAGAGSRAALNLNGTSWTFEGWLTIPSAVPFDPILTTRNGSNGDGIMFDVRTVGSNQVFNLFIDPRGGTGNQSDVGTAYETASSFQAVLAPVGTPFHFALTYDGSSHFELFLNGVSKATHTTAMNLSHVDSAANDFFTLLGRANDADGSFGGSADEFRLSKRVLTSSEFLSALSPYATWANGYLPANNVSNKAGDNDGDTLTNLQEFAFGTNPTVSYSGPILYDLNGNVTTPGSPVATNFAVGSGVDFRAVFGRRKDYVTAGLTYTVQFSAGLDVWVNSAATPTRLTGASSTGDIDAYSVPYPLFITTARGVEKPTFLRVAVTSN